MLKYILLLTLPMAIFVGCKEDDEKDEQVQACMCSGTYTQYSDPDTSSTYGIYIPNIFTPNGDGVNDFFQAIVSGVDQISITIKDGNNIVFTADSLSAWEGTINGNPITGCQTFDYIIDVTFGNGVTKHFENTVTNTGDDLIPPCPDSLPKCVFESQFDPTIPGFNPSIPASDLNGC